MISGICKVLFGLIGVIAAAATLLGMLIDARLAAGAFGALVVSIVIFLLSEIAESLDAIARHTGAVTPKALPEIDAERNEAARVM